MKNIKKIFAVALDAQWEKKRKKRRNLTAEFDQLTRWHFSAVNDADRSLHKKREKNKV